MLCTVEENSSRDNHMCISIEFACHRTSLQVCDVVSERRVGQMRIQFWKDTIDAVYKVTML